MEANFNFKRVIATVLVVANIVASSGFAVFAGSVSQMVYDATVYSISEPQNYYLMYQEEIYHYEENVTYFGTNNSENLPNNSEDNIHNNNSNNNSNNIEPEESFDEAGEENLLAEETEEEAEEESEEELEEEQDLIVAL